MYGASFNLNLRKTFKGCLTPVVVVSVIKRGGAKNARDDANIFELQGVLQ